MIETPRLLLRPWRTEDEEPFAALCADPGVMRYMPEGRPLGREESATKLALLRSFLEEHGYGWWAVKERQNGRFTGRAGLTHTNAENTAFPGETEIGCVLAPHGQARGLGTEAARACMEHAFDALGAHTVYAVADHRNQAALRTMRRLGMSPAGTLTSRGLDCMRYETARPQANAAHSPGTG